MFKNYLKIAYRNILKSKVYSLINILGLALGISCCIVIFLYVTNEMSYDKYHKNLDYIYRVAVKSQSTTATSAAARICAPVGQVLKDKFPQVDKVARILPVQSGLVKYQDKMFYEDNRMFAETELFSILTIPFLKGNPVTALDRPATVVISERIATKYFGQENPIGKLIEINTREYEITGVAKDFPANTHFKYDLFLSLKTLENRYPFDAWFLSNIFTYIKIKPDIDFNAFSRQVNLIAENYAEKDVDDQEIITYFLQPVADIHLHSHLLSEKEPGVNPLYLYIFSAIGVFIMLIACINFMNLTTARSTKRAKEVGMRKVIGAQKRQLIVQFLGEAIIMSLISLIISFVIVQTLLPFLSNLTGKLFILDDLTCPAVLYIFISLGLLVGIVSGSYPAFFLSAFKPISIIKNSLKISSGGAILRKTLVIVQFAISIALISGTFIVYQQLNFMKNKQLGIDKEQKLIIPVRGGISINENYEAVKSEFMKHTAIIGATASGEVPGQSTDRWDTQIIEPETNEFHVVRNFYTDHDFINEYNIKLIAGRSFDKDMATDVNNALILNLTAIKEFGWSTPEEAIGKRIEGAHKGEIVGVMADFHYFGLHNIIEPLALSYRPNRFDNITLSVTTENLSETISFVEKKWKELFPNNPFQYFFLNECFNQQYSADEKFGQLFGTFAMLGIFIACLGLFGLTSYSVEQRTREIGVRKVLGASTTSIVQLLSKEFLKLIIFANFIACPIAFFTMKEWLQNYYYRINIQLEIFLMAGVLALFIALFTVSWQAIKAAIANPVNALKYE